MNFFNFDLKKILVILALIGAPLISVNLQMRSGSIPWIVRPFYFLSGTTQDAFGGFSSGVRSTADLYLNLINIKRQNRELGTEIAELKAQLGALTELKLENERLSKLLDFKQRSNMDILAARIIGQDLLIDYDTVTIDRGTEHGVKKGMAIMAINGVVGYVIQTEKQTSRVLLMTDRYAVIDAIVQRSRSRGIVHGMTKDSCVLSYLRRNDDVQIGDIVVTSGLDNVFPKGFPIGTVTAVKNDQYGLGQEVTLLPIVNVSNLEEVFVVRNTNHQDFEKLAADANAETKDPQQ